MENCAAELVIHVPKGGSPELAKMLIDSIASRIPGSEGPLALFSVTGGTLTLKDDNAPYGNPYGVRPDDLPDRIDWDLHVAAHFDWEATIVRMRSGVRTELASASCEPDPLMSKDDLERILREPGGDRAALEIRLRSFFGTPPPGYETGPRAVTVDWDGAISET